MQRFTHTTSVSSSSKIAEDLFLILKIAFAKSLLHIFFLLQNLKVKHYCGKNRKSNGKRIKIHKGNAYVHKVKAEEGGVAAERVNSAGNKFGFVFFGNTGTPTVPHTYYGNKKDYIADNTDAKTGESCAGGHMAPTENNGGKLRKNNSEGRYRHKRFNGMYA